MAGEISTDRNSLKGFTNDGFSEDAKGNDQDETGEQGHIPNNRGYANDGFSENAKGNNEDETGEQGHSPSNDGFSEDAKGNNEDETGEQGHIPNNRVYANDGFSEDAKGNNEDQTGEQGHSPSNRGYANDGFSEDVKGSNSEQRNESAQDQSHTAQDEAELGAQHHRTDDAAGGDDDDDDAPVDLSCGIGRFRTNAFGTKFSNLYLFASLFGFSNLFVWVTYQIVNVHLTSLERQFNINNARAGLFDTAGRVGFLSTVLFAGHFSRKAHIPYLVGANGLIQGLFLMIPAFMQFADPYTLPPLPPSKADNGSSELSDIGESAQYICGSHFGNLTNGTEDDQDFVNANKLMFGSLLMAQAVKGITDSFHNGFLPMVYMDDNLVDKSKMSIFIGIWQVIVELSNPIGRQINGAITEIPIDLKETEMDPKDRRFVAAWWLSFLIFGAATSLSSIPLMLFPRRLISEKQRLKAQELAVATFSGGQVQGHDAEQPIAGDDGQGTAVGLTSTAIEVDSETKANFSLSQRRKSTVSLKRNLSVRRASSIITPVIDPALRRASVTVDYAFDLAQTTETPPKDKETFWDEVKDFPKALFRVMKSPVFVLMLFDIAVISLPINGIQIFRQVYVANEYNVPMSEVAWVSGLTAAVGHSIGTILSSWITSKVTTNLGYMKIISSCYTITTLIIPLYFLFGCNNQPIYGATGEYGIPLNASESCHCADAKQLISCGDDGLNYLSPCYAGCDDVDGKMFINCQLLTNTSKGTSVTPGLCDTDCHTNFIIYILLDGLKGLFDSINMIPRRLIILRVVDPQDRGFATSLFMFSYELLGIPSPNLFGRVIDGTCMIWDGDYCALYDRDKIRYLMNGIDLGVQISVLISFFIMIAIYKWQAKSAKKKTEKSRVQETRL